jgi:hypothetical protein
MNANGLYNGLEGYIVPGTNSGMGNGVVNGVVNNEGNVKLKPLDKYQGGSCVFSLRKLYYSYNGPAIRVRRSNDNAEQDIGFLGNGDFNESSLVSFVGVNSGFVSTWYDQSGNGRNAIQTVTANQPRIVNSGAVDKINNKVTLFFDGSNDNMYVSSFNNTKVAAFVVFARQTGTSLGRTILRKGRTANTSLEFFIRTDVSNYLECNASTGASTVTTNTNPNTINSTAINLGVLLFNNSTVRTSINSNAYVSTNLSGNMFQGTANLLIGAGCGDESCTIGDLFWGGQISEVIIFGSEPNDVNIKSEINSYYKIY